MKLLGMLLAVSFLTSCAAKKACELDKNSETNLINTVSVKAEIGGVDTGNYYNIDTAYVSQGMLNMSIAYGGGCKVHDFKFFVSEIETMSIPGQRQAGLHHTANDDLCKAMIHADLAIDLSVLDGREVVLNLDGWKTPIHINAKK